MQEESTNQRDHFRLVYPIGARPKLEFSTDKNSVEVVEISQGGFRILGAVELLKCDDEITGLLKFHDHSKKVVAKVKRIFEETIVFELQEKIPIQELLMEQVRIRRDFPS